MASTFLPNRTRKHRRSINRPTLLPANLPKLKTTLQHRRRRPSHHRLPLHPQGSPSVLVLTETRHIGYIPRLYTHNPNAFSPPSPTPLPAARVPPLPRHLNLAGSLSQYIHLDHLITLANAPNMLTQQEELAIGSTRIAMHVNVLMYRIANGEHTVPLDNPMPNHPLRDSNIVVVVPCSC